uniref:programmed cell death protein 4-like n=1 Tax=Ciona intestinalis TaxID=7719 RepID=UPI00006A5A58|nr:programmed cell death protein 4-like [Ciona intestinalis]|eukprot:XP_026691369.1 programmed cell death protein 4-like [Ciona intestinalis]
MEARNTDVTANGIDAERNKAKDKKRTRRDSHKAKDSPITGVITNGASANGAVKRSGKLGDRKSRSIYGRGLPKKGGAGGKGTWGRLGDEMQPLPSCLDDHDPNYDSEEQEEITYKAVKPEWNRDEVEKTVIPIINEYFEHTQKEEAIESLGSLNIGDKKALVVICLVTLALERKNEFRELASELLKAFMTPLHHIQSNGNSNGNHSGKFGSALISKDDVIIGLLALCDDLPELILDTPDAPEVLGKFIARAISDNAVSSDIIETMMEEPDCELIMACAKEVKCQLKIHHNKLKNVWGVAGGIQPVSVLKGKITALLKEYLSSGDSEEAMRCVADLDVPHFHHELVYEAVVMAIEVSTDRASNMLVHLLKRFADTTVVTADQLTQGFRRVYDEMPDINLDVPNAYFYLEQIVNKCHDLKVISLKLKVQAPNRSRKRFVSEGDGGRLKNYKNDSYFDLV